MAYVAVADPLLDSGKPIRSTDGKRMRDNQADFNTRIAALEAAPDAYVSSHFTRRSGYASDQIIGFAAATSTASMQNYEDRWFLKLESFAAATLYFSEGVSVSDNLEHYLNLFIDASGAGTDYGVVQSSVAFNFTYSTLPITFEARVTFPHNDPTSFRIGLRNFALNNAAPTDGIFLERNGANFRFRTVNASVSTNGSDFAPPTASTWFIVKVIFTNSPSNQALCYLDGALKDTLTGANLPTAKNLHARFEVTDKTGAGVVWKLDEMRCYAAANVADLT